jgi:hypothetical protein
MEKAQHAPNKYVFVIRLWQEPSLSDQNTWRGRIENVQNKTVKYFNDLEEVTSFLQSCMEIQPERKDK